MLFRDIIAPIKQVAFLYNGVRARKIVHLHDRNEHLYDPLMTKEDIEKDMLLSPFDHLAYFIDGKTQHPKSYKEIEEAQTNHQSVLRSYTPDTHQFKELLELEQDIRKIFHSEHAWTNMYWSKTKQALKPHRDPDTIIVLQIYGQKLWDFYRDGVDWKTNQPVEQLIMKPGDLLFFPKRTGHSAITTNGNDSIHLTIEIRTPFDRGL